MRWSYWLLVETASWINNLHSYIELTVFGTKFNNALKGVDMWKFAKFIYKFCISYTPNPLFEWNLKFIVSTLKAWTSEKAELAGVQAFKLLHIKFESESNNKT